MNVYDEYVDRRIPISSDTIRSLHERTTEIYSLSQIHDDAIESWVTSMFTKMEAVFTMLENIFGMTALRKQPHYTKDEEFGVLAYNINHARFGAAEADCICRTLWNYYLALRNSEGRSTEFQLLSAVDVERFAEDYRVDFEALSTRLSGGILPEGSPYTFE
jgi:hypothetical protein